MTAGTQASPSIRAPEGVELLGPVAPGYERMLTPEALAFVAGLERRFGRRRRELLAYRQDVQARLDAGWRPDFREDTREIREADWTIAPVPDDLQDRRVEITGPVDRKMVINALNSGANVFMADFEDAESPTWDNLIEGQINLCEAVRGTLRHEDPQSGKVYELGEKPATLVVRPRGWHLPEAHVRVDGEAMTGGLLDFGLYLFHNAGALRDKGTGPYFYLPKLERYEEAALWNDVFVHAQEALGLPRGTIKATVLIETVMAVFEMDEILHALREHVCGLNCGRWDYIFSFIKRFRAHPEFVLPDRNQVTMTRHFLRSYSLLLIQQCHRRGAHAMGGMAAQIPVREDPEASREALEKVRADKEREANDGHDGTWVAHPGLIETARAAFDQAMPQPNQIDRKREDVRVTRDDLLQVPDGTITEGVLRHNINVGVFYIEAWLRGSGCVPLYNLMEDAATAEICRTQVWQWRRHRARMDDGRPIDDALVRQMFGEEMARIRQSVGGERYRTGRFQEAADLFADLAFAGELAEFLTLPAYQRIVTLARG